MERQLVYQIALIVLLAGGFSDAQTNSTEVLPEATSDASCEASQIDEYSMPWHIAGIFIVLGCSGAGIFSTLALGTKAHEPFFARILQIIKMFGIGVIAATGWCHLIPDAFESFTSECLPEGWATYGGAFVGVFALASSFIVQSIELAAGVTHSHGIPPPSPVVIKPDVPHPHGSEVLQLETESHRRSQGISTMILEAGIIFHSIIIGLSLGVTGDLNTFKTLLTAICFHQFFEGLALGALIAKLESGAIFKFFVMGLIYPLTTPIGMMIGIGIRTSYNENASGAILAEGILNSLS